MKRNWFINVLLSFGLVIIVAGLGSLFAGLGMDWFMGLVTPSQWIPGFVIPIVWTVIYITASVVIFLWLNGGMPRNIAILFGINGVLNVLWCLLFFTLQLTFLGQVAIVINLIFAWVLLYNIFKEKEVYGLVLSIYPIWLSLATCLNLAIWILN